jgi:transcriptional regulator with XRE-family HTH domain
MAKTRQSSRPEDIGRRIKERREARGFTQEQLAAVSGVTQGTLSSLEKGRTKEPEASTILSVAAALKTSPYMLMYDHLPPAAVEHTIAAIAHVWDRLTDRQRLQVIAYAQGLLDAGTGPSSGPHWPPTPSSRPPDSN